jgi:hypothetical protein
LVVGGFAVVLLVLSHVRNSAEALARRNAEALTATIEATGASVLKSVNVQRTTLGGQLSADVKRIVACVDAQESALASSVAEQELALGKMGGGLMLRMDKVAEELSASIQEGRKGLSRDIEVVGKQVTTTVAQHQKTTVEELMGHAKAIQSALSSLQQGMSKSLKGVGETVADQTCEAVRERLVEHVGSALGDFGEATRKAVCDAVRANVAEYIAGALAEYEGAVRQQLSESLLKMWEHLEAKAVASTTLQTTVDAAVAKSREAQHEAWRLTEELQRRTTHADSLAARVTALARELALANERIDRATTEAAALVTERDALKRQLGEQGDAHLRLTKAETLLRSAEQSMARTGEALPAGLVEAMALVYGDGWHESPDALRVLAGYVSLVAACRRGDWASLRDSSRLLDRAMFDQAGGIAAKLAEARTALAPLIRHRVERFCTIEWPAEGSLIDRERHEVQSGAGTLVAVAISGAILDLKGRVVQRALVVARMPEFKGGVRM